MWYLNTRKDFEFWSSIATVSKIILRSLNEQFASTMVRNDNISKLASAVVPDIATFLLSNFTSPFYLSISVHLVLKKINPK